MDYTNEMNAASALANAWGPFEVRIQDTLAKLAQAPMPEEAEFLWFVLLPNDLRGIPIIVWPTGRDQQQHDRWEHERDLMECVPESIELPALADTPENVDRLRDACASFLGVQWRALHPAPERLAYFSINDDGWYFSLRDGRRISAWDIEEEISEVLRSNRR